MDDSATHWPDDEQLAFLAIARMPEHLRPEALQDRGLAPARFALWRHELLKHLQPAATSPPEEPDQNQDDETAASEITQLLGAWSAGKSEALHALVARVYPDLRSIAERSFKKEPANHTLQPTALVHELYLRFSNQRRVQWHGRTEFFAVAAVMIRRILVDHARKRQALKRGADVVRVELQEELLMPEQLDPNILALNDALTDLAELDPDKCELLQLRHFAGLTLDEIAEVKKVSRSTVKRELKVANLWLLRELDPDYRAGSKKKSDQT